MRKAWNKGLKNWTNSGSYKKGHNVSKEILEKMRISRLGKPSNAKGKKWKEEAKKKKSKARKGMWTGEKNPQWKGGISTYERKLYLNGRRRVKKLNAEGSHTFGEWKLLKKQYGYKCSCCSKKEPEIVLTEDHIIPLSKGGSDYIENIQPLCRSCNSQKHTKIIKYEFENRCKLGTASFAKPS